MGEISAASNQQSLGVAQVGEAISHMDQATQQNAALVEEMAAAASSLKSQAQDLVQTVAVFKLSNQQAATQPAPAARRVNFSTTPKAIAKPPARAQTKLNPVTPSRAASRLPAPSKAPPRSSKPAAADDEWETF